jgi:signal transduction histidine kinase
VASQPAPTPRERAVDAGVALAAFAVSVALLARGGVDDTRALDAAGVGLAALASLPLAVWRREPLAVFALTAAASAVLNGLGYPPGPPVGPTAALVLLALAPERTRAPRWLAGATLVVLYLAHAAATGIADDAFPTVPLLFGALVWGGALVVGDRIRLRRARLAELEERARRTERDAERERRLAAAEERTRIARDLHDSAGHAINVILVHAGAARLLGEDDPERARAALETIDEVARETLGEIDQLVRGLRENGEVSAGVEPPAGLAALGTLVERHRSAGLAVDVRTRGVHRQLAPAVDRAAYRILQEALTNAARHGAGAAEIEVAYGDAELELAVRNALGPAGDPGAGGHGLVGMRERAALLGGALDARAADGTFVVHARLPYGGGEG